MNKFFTKTQHKKHRQQLRNNMPEPEIRLWQILRSRQMGVKFRRQHSIGDYIVDFYCPALKLIIEIDGDSHFTENAQRCDKVRDNFMLSLNIMTIRIKNNDVIENIDGVYQHIKNQLNLRTKEIVND